MCPGVTHIQRQIKREYQAQCFITLQITTADQYNTAGSESSFTARF